MSILVLNAGSSNLKYALFDDRARQQLAGGQKQWDIEQAAAVADAVRATVTTDIATQVARSPLRTVGHRVVHGGAAFSKSVRIDRHVLDQLDRLSILAPLHNPPGLATIAAAQDLLPDIPHIAVFDTAFYSYLPASAHVYPLPYEWYERWGVRRFGFHGISHAYCAARSGEMLASTSSELRVLICHLGNGSSATAVRGGAAVATTMGFTPMEGLMMGTRAGSVDPGILLYALRQRGLSAEQLDQVLNKQSGLLGVSGLSADFREVENAAKQGSERARLALEIYTARVRSAVGALAAALGGVDALVFTAGVGENAAGLRAAVCEGLEFLGLSLDPTRNSAARPDADIARDNSPARILVIHTRENLMIAREARRLA